LKNALNKTQSEHQWGPNMKNKQQRHKEIVHIDRWDWGLVDLGLISGIINCGSKPKVKNLD